MQEIRSSDEIEKRIRSFRRRPVPKWKLIDSILYINKRDQYLQKTGILRKVGRRRWKLRIT